MTTEIITEETLTSLQITIKVKKTNKKDTAEMKPYIYLDILEKNYLKIYKYI